MFEYIISAAGLYALYRNGTLGSVAAIGAAAASTFVVYKMLTYTPTDRSVLTERHHGYADQTWDWRSDQNIRTVVATKIPGAHDLFIVDYDNVFHKMTRVDLDEMEHVGIGVRMK